MEETNIICNINLGLLNQTIYIQHNGMLETRQLTLKEIPNFLAHQQTVKNIYLTGVNLTFLKQIEKDTNEIENSLYNQNTKIFHYNEEIK